MSNKLLRLREPGSSVDLWLPLDAECSGIRDAYNALTPTQKRALIRAAKPAPDADKLWAIQADCVLDGPIWRVDRNTDTNSLSVYATSPVNATRKTRLTALNQIPAATPVTKTMEYKAAGWERTGVFSAGIFTQASLYNPLANGTYMLELLDGANVVLESKTIVVTATEPHLAFTSENNQSPIVSSAMIDYNLTVGSQATISLPTNQFSDPDGSIVSISVTGLPAGLSYNSSTKLITGSPTTAGTSTVIVTATDNGGLTVSDVFLITVASAQGFTPGVNEVYSGVFTSSPGLATRPDRLALTMVSYDATTQRAIVANSVTRSADSGREFAWQVNGSDTWLSGSAFAALRFAAGSYYLVHMIERAIGDTDRDNMEQRQADQGYYVAEQSFQIY